MTTKTAFFNDKYAGIRTNSSDTPSHTMLHAASNRDKRLIGHFLDTVIKITIVRRINTTYTLKYQQIIMNKIFQAEILEAIGFYGYKICSECIWNEFSSFERTNKSDNDKSNNCSHETTFWNQPVLIIIKRKCYEECESKSILTPQNHIYYLLDILQTYVNIIILYFALHE